MSGVLGKASGPSVRRLRRERCDMSDSYAIMLGRSERQVDEASFLGGRPRLPRNVELPCCALCGAIQTFFFQLAFPEDHEWEAYTLAVFACTRCADENWLVPEMLSVPLRDADVPGDFLARYQRNFRFLVFETESAFLVPSYQEQVRFSRLQFVPGLQSSFGHVGGRASWILEDEAPATIAVRSPATFLLQLNLNVEFETVPGSARQVEIGLDGTPEPSPDDCLSTVSRQRHLLLRAEQTGTGHRVCIYSGRVARARPPAPIIRGAAAAHGPGGAWSRLGSRRLGARARRRRRGRSGGHLGGPRIMGYPTGARRRDHRS
jgi:hypothetical protein